MFDGPATRKPLRVFYAAGPGDVINTYRHWREGRDDPNEVAQTYSGQFFSVCRDRGWQGYIVSSHLRRERTEEGPFQIEHRPDPSVGTRGVRYHLFSAVYLLRLMVSALRWRADVVVVSNANYWFLLSLLPIFGTKVVPTLHCVLWPKYHKPRRIRALIAWFNGLFFRHGTAAILYISEDVARQIYTPRRRHKNAHAFVPIFIRGSLAATAPPPSPPFRVCFAGRIERDKGVFTLLEICQRFRASGRFDIVFDLCGGGSAISELRDRVEKNNLETQFHVHGKLGRDELINFYNRSNIVIAPTTADFAEGFNKVVAEGVLAGRPVVTSEVCPAVEYFPGSLVTVPPDDVGAYEDAILKLADDPLYYRERCVACRDTRELFFDWARGWGAAFERALSPLGC